MNSNDPKKPAIDCTTKRLTFQYNCFHRQLHNQMVWPKKKVRKKKNKTSDVRLILAWVSRQERYSLESDFFT